MNPFERNYTDQIVALLALYEENSFVAAGKALQRHPTIVSKRIADLEARLEVRLVERSTRHIKFTEAGVHFVRHLQKARNVLLEAEQEVSDRSEQPTGTLRLALPAAFGRMWLAPMIATFIQQYPSLTVHAEYSDLFIDIIGGGFDAAIRVGELPDSRLKARKLSDNHRILCAAPDYLSKYGMPKIPSDLAEHNCLGFTNFANFPAWKLYCSRKKESVVVRGNLTSNDNESLLAAALQGIGILAGGNWLTSREISTGRLIHVLPEWKLDAQSGIYFVRPSAHYAPAKVKVFKEWMEQQFANGPPWL